MSSLRNAVKRRTHKERSQPADRNRFGLLEKHKDYVLRAKDFHRKEQTIQALKEKAAFKNPDEFYYKMIRSKSVDGIHRQMNGGKQYSQEELLLMKTQDVRYVQHKAQAEQKKVDQLRGILHSTGQTPDNTHIYFAEDRDEAEILNKQVDEPRVLLQVPRRIKRKQAAAYRELEERSERAAKLKNMAIEMTIQKQILSKGKKRKVEGENGQGAYKWRQERKK